MIKELNSICSSYTPNVYPVKKKVVVSGRYIELYEYEKPYFVGFPRLSRKKHIKPILEPIEQDKIRSDNVRRAKIKIRRIINSNEKELTKFLTLTFRDNIEDLSIANKQLDIFLKKLRRLFPFLKYVAVPEFQKRGAIHYHILVNIKPYISNDELAKIWGNGFAWFRNIKNCSNLGAYLTKYLSKEISDKRYFHKKKYFFSKNLLKPVILDFSFKIREFYLILKKYSKKMVFSNSFDTDFLGKIKYKQLVLLN